MVYLKSELEIEKMAAAGKIVGTVLHAIRQEIKPGITTWQIDQIARKMIAASGGEPSFLGYGRPPFPAAVCTSLDEEVVHGIPHRERQLAEGMIVSVDVGVELDGFHADAARTFAVGQISAEKNALIEVTRQSFWLALARAVPGNRLGDLSSAIQDYAELNGYSIVRELTGHGIGRNLHEEPDLPNFGRAGHGLRLEPGMALAMEPMINLGKRQVRLKADGWTIVTADSMPSAHYENTFVVTDTKPQVLTLEPGEVYDAA